MKVVYGLRSTTMDMTAFKANYNTQHSTAEFPNNKLSVNVHCE